MSEREENSLECEDAWCLLYTADRHRLLLNCIILSPGNLNPQPFWVLQTCFLFQHWKHFWWKQYRGKILKSDIKSEICIYLLNLLSPLHLIQLSQGRNNSPYTGTGKSRVYYLRSFTLIFFSYWGAIDMKQLALKYFLIYENTQVSFEILSIWKFLYAPTYLHTGNLCLVNTIYCGYGSF